MIKIDEILPWESYLIQIRRHLHQYPEVGFDLIKTHDFVANELQMMGIEYHSHVGKNSLLGIIKNGIGPVIGLRADMDALPITEANMTLPYRSQNDGKMHACGHDAHTAMLLGAAKYLNDHRNGWSGTVKLIFQEAEEGPNPGGAYGLCQSGLLDDVDSFFAFHVSGAFPSGTIAIKAGEALASADTIKIKLVGKGAHAAYPHLGIDPILMQAEVIVALQSIITRQLDPTENGVITVAKVSAGTTHNVIPEFAELEGTVRCFNETTRQKLQVAIEDVLKGITFMHGGTYEFQYIREYDPTINTVSEARFFHRIIEDTFGAKTFIELEKPSLGAEDFSRYTAMKKGCIAWLGSKKNDETGYSLHHPLFNIDESILKYGMLCFINIVRNYGKETQK
ncbi:MAG: amidohydrolase [Candidatus Izemoplasmatales bacterium]|jgi:amidohydrolase|nr:amidohydrolase [Candidatus Izemoplasmatales bacterium]MDD3865344.1 amidohydrolase [Candidatus Izemoplasmatales bacterium]